MTMSGDQDLHLSTRAVEVPDEPRAETAPIEVVRIERRARLYVAISVLLVLLIAAASFSAYLWHVSRAWEQRVSELTAVGYGLGQELTASRETVTEAQESIELLTDQLTASKDTVTRLQAENARWGDDAEFAQETIAGLEELLGTATAITGSLTRCIEGHDQLAVYLETPEAYEPEQLDEVRTSVTDLCTDATNQAVAFQRDVSSP